MYVMIIPLFFAWFLPFFGQTQQQHEDKFGLTLFPSELITGSLNIIFSDLVIRLNISLKVGAFRLDGAY